MNQEKQPSAPFMFGTALSLKAIDAGWVRNRSIELAGSDNEPDVEGALQEVADNLTGRMKNNAIPNTPVMVYQPGNDEDPYILAIAAHRVTPRGIRAPKPRGNGITPEHADIKGSTLREDFENMLFEEGDYPPHIIDRNDQDEYLLPWVNSQWQGFMMYHNRCTGIKEDTYKEKYDRTLGRYVIGKMNVNGSVTFYHMPYRHPTKALAVEEANKLMAQHNTSFAIFRCLDIITP